MKTGAVRLRFEDPIREQSEFNLQNSIDETLASEAMPSTIRSNGWDAFAQSFQTTTHMLRSMSLNTSEAMTSTSSAPQILPSLSFKLNSMLESASEQENYIFEQNQTSNSVAQIFLRNVLATKEGVEALHAEMLQKATDELSRKNIKALENSIGRCVAFIPCEIQYTTGEKQILTLVAISGKIQEWKDDDAFCQLQVYLKSFCQNFSSEVQIDDNTYDLGFQYVEHASRGYENLLEVMKLDPGANIRCVPCAEKKVFSELLKQLLQVEETGIANIRVLGETNVHLPGIATWNNGKKPTVSFEALIGQLNERLGEKWAALLQAFDVILDITHDVSSYESKIPASKQRATLESIANLNEQIGKIKTLSIEALKDPQNRKRLLNDMNNFVLQKLNQFSAILLKPNHEGVLPAVKQLKDEFFALLHEYDGLLKAAECDSPDSTMGFYASSSYAPGRDEAGDYRYAIEYRDACGECQKHKPAYIGSLYHASRSNRAERAFEVLPPTPPRCSFMAKVR